MSTTGSQSSLFIVSITNTSNHLCEALTDDQRVEKKEFDHGRESLFVQITELDSRQNAGCEVNLRMVAMVQEQSRAESYC